MALLAVGVFDTHFRRDTSSSASQRINESPRSDPKDSSLPDLAKTGRFRKREEDDFFAGYGADIVV